MEKTQRTTVNPATIFDPTAYGFSHSIKLMAPFELCFIAGQSGGVGSSHALPADFQAQVQEALANLKTVVESQGMSMHDIVKITLLIVDHDAQKLAIWADEAKKAWPAMALPTSTLIPVEQLALPGMLFEIDAVAQRSVM